MTYQQNYLDVLKTKIRCQSLAVRRLVEIYEAIEAGLIDDLWPNEIEAVLAEKFEDLENDENFEGGSINCEGLAKEIVYQTQNF